MRHAWRLSVLLAAFFWLISRLVAEESSWEIDYESSLIEIKAEAFGFIPARFWFESFSAKVAPGVGEEAFDSLEVTFWYPELTSGSKRKDSRVRDWLEADRYPVGRYKLTRIAQEGDRSIAIGILRLHGQEREARFKYELVETAEGTVLDAVARVDYRDWGLPTLKVLIFTVDPELVIHFRLVRAPV